MGPREGQAEGEEKVADGGEQLRVVCGGDGHLRLVKKKGDPQPRQRGRRDACVCVCVTYGVYFRLSSCTGSMCMYTYTHPTHAPSASSVSMPLSSGPAPPSRQPYERRSGLLGCRRLLLWPPPVGRVRGEGV